MSLPFCRSQHGETLSQHNTIWEVECGFHLMCQTSVWELVGTVVIPLALSALVLTLSASFPHSFQVLSQIALSHKHLSDNSIKIKNPPLTLNYFISNNAADICFSPCYSVNQM